MCTVALFQITQDWKEPKCPSTAEWVGGGVFAYEMQRELFSLEAMMTTWMEGLR